MNRPPSSSHTSRRIQAAGALLAGVLVAVLVFMALVLLTPDDGFLVRFPKALQVPLWVALRQGVFLLAAFAGGVGTALLWRPRAGAPMLSGLLAVGYIGLCLLLDPPPLSAQLLALAGLTLGPVLGGLVVQRLRLRRRRRKASRFSFEPAEETVHD